MLLKSQLLYFTMYFIVQKLKKIKNSDLPKMEGVPISALNRTTGFLNVRLGKSATFYLAASPWHITSIMEASFRGFSCGWLWASLC